jgi:hypothetical protein
MVNPSPAPFRGSGAAWMIGLFGRPRLTIVTESCDHLRELMAPVLPPPVIDTLLKLTLWKSASGKKWPPIAGASAIHSADDRAGVPGAVTVPEKHVLPFTVIVSVKSDPETYCTSP